MVCMVCLHTSHCLNMRKRTLSFGFCVNPTKTRCQHELLSRSRGSLELRCGARFSNIHHLMSSLSVKEIQKPTEEIKCKYPEV